MADQGKTQQDVLFAEQGRAGIITLNRSRALNSVTHDMIRRLEAHYLKWAKTPHIYGVILQASGGKAFSAGGDIRYLYDAGRGVKPEVLRFYREEYQHNWTLECFTKPNVALIDGIVMGGGVGVCLYGTHRVAGENVRFAMPETGIGFFPDIGGSYFLPRFPGQTGAYLGLTGTIIGQADCYYAGVATHCIPSSDFDRIRRAMAEGDPIDPVLDALHRDPGEGGLARLRPAIDRVFSAGSIEEILSRLQEETGETADWARQTAATLETKAPLSLKVTLRQLREGAKLPNLKEALKMEYRLVTRFLQAPDFFEGIRAAVIDKDQSPRWRPARLEDVSSAMVEGYFAPAGDELELTDHWALVD